MPRHLSRLGTRRSPPAFDALKVDLCLLLLLSRVLSCVNHYNLELLIHMKTQVIKKKKTHLKKGFNPAVITLPVFLFAYLLH